MYMLVLSIIEALYVVYMLNFYKSKTNYADPNISFSNIFLAHPRAHSDIPISMVCPAGHALGWLFGFYLIGREFLPQGKSENILVFGFLNMVILFFGMSLSFMNLNVLLYLSPIFAIELVRTFILLN